MLKKDQKILVLISILILTSLFLFAFPIKVGFNISNSNKFPNKELRSSISDPKIHINNNWTEAKNQGIVSGEGTYENPYSIKDKNIDGGGSGYCIKIEDSFSYFRIENCTLYNATSGIYLYSSDNGIIMNNSIFDNYKGIYTYWQCQNLDIINNTIKSNIYGIYSGFLIEKINISLNICSYNDIPIYLSTTDYSKVINNTCSYYKDDGIILSGSDNNEIANNSFSNNIYGIHLRASCYNNITDNRCFHCKVVTDCNSHNNSFIGNLITHSGFLIYGDNNTIDTSNKVNGKSVRYYCDDQEILLTNTDDVGQVIIKNCQIALFENFKIKDTKTAIFILESRNISINNVNCSNSENGIHIFNSNNVSITMSKFFNNEMDGLRVGEGGNHSIKYNEFSSNLYNGIHIESSYNNSVIKNLCSYNQNGIFIENHGIKGDNKVNNNTCKYNGEYGIIIRRDDNLTVSHNLCSNNWVGLYVDYSNFGKFYKNTDKNNDLAISIRGNNHKVINNTFLCRNWMYILGDNYVFSENNVGFGGIYITGDNNSIDSSNKIYGKSIWYFEDKSNFNISKGKDVGQIIILNCSEVYIEDNMINNTLRSITITDSYNIYLQNNEFFNNKDSIYIERLGGKNRIYNNNFTNYDIAIRISELNNTFISNNTFLNSELTGTGIYLKYTRNGTLTNNQFYHYGWNSISIYDSININISKNHCNNNEWAGISLHNSNESIIKNNTCFNNYRFGIKLGASHNNRISENNCSFNRHGINLESSKNNIIWMNIFSNNSEFQALCSSANNNSWDFNGFGNYWSDYYERYPNAINDGILWKTPYKINGTADSYDNHPLVSADIYSDINLDIIPPTWKENLKNQTIIFGESFRYDINATDNVEIDKYWINDTSNFLIDQNGIIENNTILSIGEYFIKIRVNDTSGNYIEEIIKIDVEKDNSSDDDEDDGSDGVGEDNPDDNNSEEGDNISFGFFFLLPGFLILSVLSIMLRIKKKISFK